LLPLSFEANRGQADARVQYLARGAGYTLLLAPGETVLNVGAGNAFEQVRLKLVGADPRAQITAQGPLRTRINYLIGNDRSRWHTDIPTFGKIEYRRVYPGIDIAFYGHQGQLEHDFVLAPGADPSRIAFDVTGAKKVAIDSAGDLVLSVASGEIRLLKPRVYQEIGGHRREVQGKFRLLGGKRVGFALGAYDARASVVIDPVLNWSTYLSGSTATAAKAITVDSSGNAFVAGNTSAAAFDAATSHTFGGDTGSSGTPSGGDVFIARIDNAASGNTVSGSALVYVTFIGGAALDTAAAIGLDANNVYVTGQTASVSGTAANRIPTKYGFQNTPPGAATTAYVLGIDQATGGSLAYGTYLGETTGDAAGTSMVVLPGGGSNIAEIYVAGWETGETAANANLTSAHAYQKDFAGNQAAFAVHLGVAAGSTALTYGTFLTSSGASDHVVANGIAVDSSGNLYIAGWGDAHVPAYNNSGASNAGCVVQATNSTGPVDAFVIKLDLTPNGCLQLAKGSSNGTGYATLVGGTGTDKANAIVLDSSNNAYITGSTASDGISYSPPTNLGGASIGGGTDAFIAKLNSSGAKQWLGYLGGASDDVGNAIALDANGNIVVTGYTQSAAFPKQPALGTSIWNSNLTGLDARQGSQDAFLAIVNPTNGLVFSTYLGGGAVDQGNAVALRPSPTPSTAVVAYVAGETTSDDFPVNAVAFQSARAASVNAGFVSRIAFEPTNNTAAGFTLTGSATKNTVGYANGTGTSVSYTFTLTKGANTSDYVTFDAKMPKDGSGNPLLVFNTVTPSLGTCKTTTAGITCQLGTLPAGDTTIQIDATAAAAAACAATPCTPVSFAFTGYAAAAETGDHQAKSFTTNIKPPADLSIAQTKTAAEPVHVGGTGTVSYEITASNAAASLDFASGTVTVTDNLPSGFVPETITAAVPTDWNCSSVTGSVMSQVVCTSNAVFTHGTSLSKITITGYFDPAATDLSGATPGSKSLPNQASIATSVDVFDSNSSNNSSTVSVAVVRSASLTLGVTADNNTVNLGDTIKYTVTISSDAGSADTATNVTFTNTLPTGFARSGNAVVGASGAGQATPTCATDGTGCTTGFSLVPGGTVTYEITGSYPDGVTSVIPATPSSVTRQLSSTATAQVSGTDPSSLTNVKNTPATTIQRSAKLKLEVTGVAAAGLGEEISYVFTITSDNALSKNIATNVVLAPNLPAGFVANAASVSAKTKSNSDFLTCATFTKTDTPQTPGCTGAVLDIGEVLTYTVTGTFPDDGTVLTNNTDTQVDKTNAEPPTATAAIVDAVTNPAAALTTTVKRSANLTLNVTAPGTAKVNQVVSYVYTLESASSSYSVATNIALTPNLPSTFQPTKATATKTKTKSDVSTCAAFDTSLGDPVPASLGCTAAKLDVGDSIVYTVFGKYPDNNTVLPDDTADHADQSNATKPDVTAAIVEAITNNATPITTTAQRSAILALVASGPATAKLDEAITYTYTLHSDAASLAVATNVALTPYLPTKFKPTKATATKTSANSSVSTCAVFDTGLGDPVPGTLGCTAGAKVDIGDSIVYTVYGTYPDDDSVLTDPTVASAGQTGAANPAADAAIVEKATSITNPSTAVSTTSQRYAELELTIEPASATTVALDEDVTYIVHLKNTKAGNNKATNVSLITVSGSEPLGVPPAGFHVSSTLKTESGGATATCQADGSGCTLGTIPLGGELQYAITGKFLSSDADALDNVTMTRQKTGTVSATAAVVDNSFTRDITNNQVKVERVATLTLGVAGPAGTVNLGDPVTYTITLSSAAASPNTATDVRLARTKLPDGFQVSSVSVSGVADALCDKTTAATGCSGNVGDSGITLAPGGSIVYTISGTYPDGTTALAANVKSDTTTKFFTFDSSAAVNRTVPTSVSNTATALERSAKLTLGASGPANASMGQAIDYVYTLTSSASPISKNIATGVALTLNLPTGFAATSATAVVTSVKSDQSGCALAPPVGCSGVMLDVGDTLTYTVHGSFPDGTLPEGSSSAAQSGTAAPSAAALGIVDAVTNPDPVTGILSTNVARYAHLSLTATSDAPSCTYAGGASSCIKLAQTTTYTFTVTNIAETGPPPSSIATGIALTPVFPDGFKPTSATASATGTNSSTASCAVGSTTSPGCTAAKVDVGGTLTYVVTGTFPDDDTVLTDPATHYIDKTGAVSGLTAATTGPIDLPASGLGTRVLRSATLQMTITPSSPTISLDKDITYTLRLANTAGNKATNVSLIAISPTDPKGILPVGFHPTSAAATPAGAGTLVGTCVEGATTTPTGCTGATIPVGGYIDYAITGTFPASDLTALDTTHATSAKTSTGSGSAAIIEAPVTVENGATTVQRLATLALSVTGAPGTVKLGDSLTYTITLSSSADPALSPNTATNVRLALNGVLPPGFQVAAGGVAVTGVDSSLCDMTLAATGCSGNVGDSGITLAPGASIVYQVTGTYPDGTTALAADVKSDNTTKFFTWDGSASINKTVPTGVKNTATVVQRSATLTLSIDPATATTINLDNAGSGFPSSTTYTVNLKNTAGNTATAVNLTTGGLNSVLPSGFHPTSASVTTVGAGTLVGTCQTGSTTTASGCTGATVPLNGEIHYAITGTFPQSALSATKNSDTSTVTASVAAGIAEADVNASNSNVTVQRSSDLQISQLADSSPVSPVPMSGPLRMNTSFKNAGPDDAVSVNVVYTLPLNNYTVWATSFPGGCDLQTPAPNKITCKSGGLNVADGTKNYSVSFVPDPAAIADNAVPPEALNQAISASVVSAYVVDQGAVGNGTSSTTFDLRRQSDLKITALTDNGTPGVPLTGPGQLTLYTSVQNGGYDAAPNVRVTYSSTSGNIALAGNNYDGGCVQTNSALITCSVTNTTTQVKMPVSTTLPYQVQLTPDNTGVTQSKQFVINVAIASDNTSDAVPGNNGTSITSTISRIADLKIVAQADKAPNGAASSATNPVPQAGPLQLLTTVQNLSGDDATAVKVAYTFPTTGFSLVSTAYDGVNNTYPGGCVIKADTGGVLRIAECSTADPLTTAAGAVQYKLSVTPDPAWVPNDQKTYPRTIDVKISSAQVSDSDATNNTGSSTPTFGRVSDLRIHTAADLGPDGLNPSSNSNAVALAGPMTFTTTIENVGDTAKGVQIEYTLPSTWSTYQIPGNSGFSACTPASNKITCTVGPDIPNGVFPTAFTLQVTPFPNALGSNVLLPITTGTTVISPYVYDDGTNGAIGSNNSTNISTTLARKADLQLLSMTDNRSASGSVGAAGPLILTTTARNNGDDDATSNVIVTYTFPVAITNDYALVTTGQSNNYPGGCVAGPGANQVKCTIGSLNKSTNASYWVAVTPDPGAIPGTDKTATIYPQATVSSLSVYDGGAVGGIGSNNTYVNPSGTVLERLVNLSISPITSTIGAGAFANLGQSVTYTIQVNNAAQTSTTGGSNTSDAYGVTVALGLPAHFTATGTTGSDAGWSCPGFTTCTFSGSIPSGGNSKLKITGYYDDDPTIDLPGGGPYSGGTYKVGQGNVGALSATVGSTASTNSQAWPAAVTTTTDIQRRVSISATALSNPASGSGYASLGTNITYTVTVANASGMNKAAGMSVDIADTSGTQAKFTGALTQASLDAGWSCLPANFSTWPVHCALSGSIAANSASTLVFTGQYADDPASTKLTGGRATVSLVAAPATTQSYSATLPLPASAPAATDIQRTVHLSAVHTSSPQAGVAYADLGTTVQYSVQVYNDQNLTDPNTNTADGVTVKEVFPANFLPLTSSAGWTCPSPLPTLSPITCTYTGTIAKGFSATLTITGKYSDEVALQPTPSPTATTLSGGTGNVTVTGTVNSTASYDATLPSSWPTSTDIRRNVQLSLTAITPSAQPVSLGDSITYTVRAVAAAGPVGTPFNTADLVSITFTMPAGFQFTSAGSGWSCGAVTPGANNTSSITCSIPSLAAGAYSDPLTITGLYDPALDLSSGAGSGYNSAVVSTGRSYDNPATKTASYTSTIQRNVGLSLSLDANPKIVGAETDAVTYTITVNNTGPNNVITGTGQPDAVTVHFTVPMPGSFKNISTGGATCDTSAAMTTGDVACHYPTQLMGSPTAITVAGKFDKAVIPSCTANDCPGKVGASASASVSAVGAIETDLGNNSASIGVTVVDTPTGTSITPLLDVTGAPITVTYPSVSIAGVTKQQVFTTAPLGFTEPAVPGADYTTSQPVYFVLGIDTAARVTYTTPVQVCGKYTLLPATFLKPARLRMFDSAGNDITSSLNTTPGQESVCGLTNNVSPGAFTIREPRNRKPVAVAKATQIVSGVQIQIGTNQFILDAAGSTDPDVHQICNGTPQGAGAIYCGDSITGTWTGPAGMNPADTVHNGTTYSFTLTPDADGNLGTAPQSLPLSFPLGVSNVTLVLTDQAGTSSDPVSVSVSVSTFALSTTAQSATISAGQATSFQVLPQDANHNQLAFSGTMTLACSGTRASDGSSLATNHIGCVLSPSSITQGQFATALITTTGPNYSMVKPLPGSQRESLALLLGLGTLPVAGLLLLPGGRRRRRTWLLTLLVVGFLGMLLACGGSSTPPPAQQIQPSTPAGTYTVTITGTAAGGITSTNTFTLTVH
jgi:uncharacterized repeat protein (TIGR01451 family)